MSRGAPGIRVAAIALLAMAAVPWAARAQTAAAPAAAAPTVAAPTAPASDMPKRTPAPNEAYVYIGWPNDGEVIRSTKFKVWFGARHIGVAPAGTHLPGTGHHHLLIDTELPPMDEPIPNDRNHLHFGIGQTESVVELPPGRHTLQLLMADGDHVPHDPPLMSKRITIYVRPGGQAPVASR